MDKVIYTKLSNILKSEGNFIMNSNEDIIQKVEKMNTLYNLKKILDNYDELEGILKKFFDEKADKQKFQR